MIRRATKPAMSPKTIQDDRDMRISGGYASLAMPRSGAHLAIGLAAYWRITAASVRRRT
jgi:hypothetical protein